MTSSLLFGAREAKKLDGDLSLKELGFTPEEEQELSDALVDTLVAAAWVAHQDDESGISNAESSFAREFDGDVDDIYCFLEQSGMWFAKLNGVFVSEKNKKQSCILLDKLLTKAFFPLDPEHVVWFSTEKAFDDLLKMDLMLINGAM